MGIFDRLFGKKKQDAEEEAQVDAEEEAQASVAEPAAAKTWKQRFEAAARAPNFDWEWGNAPAHKIVHEFLSEAAPDFGTPDKPAKIKERPDDENIDLRGSYDRSPIRFAVWMSFGSFWTIEMKVPMNQNVIALERDLEKVPKAGDEDDPFDDDEERRVFVGKGVFLEGDDEDIARKLELWRALPEDARDAIVEGMSDVDARALYYAGESIILSQTPGLPDLDDPVGYMRACGDLLVKLRDAVGGADFPELMAETPAAGAGMGVACKYCSSLYFLSPGHPRCPNCGAPAEG
jgi:hypothetical protein